MSAKPLGSDSKGVQLDPVTSEETGGSHGHYPKASPEEIVSAEEQNPEQPPEPAAKDGGAGDGGRRRLRWKKNTFAIWDNRNCIHHAFNDYDGYRREMYRTTVLGEEPI